MYKPSPKIINFIEKRIKRLKKLQKTAFIFDVAINLLIMLINISSIVLALFILSIEYNNLSIENKKTFFTALNALGYSTYFAALIIILFILSIIFAIYKTNTKYQKYRQTYKDFEYLVVKFKNVKEYTLEEFQNDLDIIEIRNLKFKKNKWYRSIRDILLKKVN